METSVQFPWPEPVGGTQVTRLFYHWNPVRDVICWAGNGESLLGYQEMELPQTRASWLALLHPDDRFTAETKFGQLETNRHPFSLQFRVRGKDEGYRHVQGEAAFLADGTMIGAIHRWDGKPSLENQLTLLLNSAYLGIFIALADGTISFANPSGHTIFGYPMGELVGQSIESLVPESLCQRHVELRESFFRNPAERLMVGRHLNARKKNGQEFPVAVGLNPLKFGESIKVICTVIDLTEMKRAEGDLVRFFDLSLDLFCIANLDGYFVRVNQNFARVLGYPEEMLLTRPFLDFVHPDDREATLAEVARLSSGLPVAQFRNRYRDMRGDYHWFEWTSRSIPDEGTIFAVARDISERVDMERELQVREERERAILDNSTAVIYVKGTDGRYQFVNRCFSEFFALDRKTVIGKTDQEIFPPSSASTFQRNDCRVIKTGETLNVQEIIPHQDGNHTYISVKFPLFDAKGKVTALAGISTDITDQILARETEQQLRLARVFQQKLYPTKPPMFPGLDIGGSAVPVSQVCGDYFDYIRRADNRLVVCVADVSGHGFGPALQMVEVRAVLRMLLASQADLGTTVEELNRLLCVDLPESSFVSLFLVEVDMDKGHFQYVGAGHRALLVLTSGEIWHLDSTGPLLGIDDTATFAVTGPVPLEPGCILLLFTDGLTDTLSLDGEPFGKKRLMEVVQRHRRESSQEIIQNLFLAVYDFAQGRTIQDDITAISLKVLE